jgi:hypothetical protein
MDFTQNQVPGRRGILVFSSQFLGVNAQQNTEDSRRRSPTMLSEFPSEGDQGDQECCLLILFADESFKLNQQKETIFTLR